MLKLALRWIQELALSRRYFWVIAVAVLVGDAALTQVIIRYVPCGLPHPHKLPWYKAHSRIDTEIDFATYMYHVNLYRQGERDYSKIIGPSGPLVYVTVRSLLHLPLSSDLSKLPSRPCLHSSFTFGHHFWRL